MKKTTSIIIAFVFVFLLVGCSSGNNSSKNQKNKLNTENYISIEKAITVKTKMKKYEVKEILGKPNKTIDDQEEIYDNVDKDFSNISDIYDSIGGTIPTDDKEKIKTKLVDLKYTKFSIDDDVKIQQLQYKTKNKEDGKTKIENVNFYFQDNTLISSSVKRIE